jgi:hypothetical protein
MGISLPTSGPQLLEVIHEALACFWLASRVWGLGAEHRYELSQLDGIVSIKGQSNGQQ